MQGWLNDKISQDYGQNAVIEVANWNDDLTVDFICKGGTQRDVCPGPKYDLVGPCTDLYNTTPTMITHHPHFKNFPPIFLQALFKKALRKRKLTTKP